MPRALASRPSPAHRRLLVKSPRRFPGSDRAPASRRPWALSLRLSKPSVEPDVGPLASRSLPSRSIALRSTPARPRPRPQGTESSFTGRPRRASHPPALGAHDDRAWRRPRFLGRKRVARRRPRTNPTEAPWPSQDVLPEGRTGSPLHSVEPGAPGERRRKASRPPEARSDLHPPPRVLRNPPPETRFR